ncbi:hypothetical protein WN48_00952 [Eufriesea mexicana]|uniref:Uncharacterized protein n=1 Tax=Eufriesea mexicana TaxID=516756 RepID=A0A310S549_9HYME|nr:hypothetical protein WN48_00952 [Eufriesea mexicana]
MQLMISLGSSLLRLFSRLAIRRAERVHGVRVAGFHRAWAVVRRRVVEWENISVRKGGSV